MRAYALEHVPFEGLGEIEPWLLSHGHTVKRTRFWREEPLPEVRDVDWLIIMGGPMGVADEEDFPWLREEKALIRKAIDAGTLVFGICLGAQLVAEVLGARVYRNRWKEIGWFPVELTDEGQRSPFLAGMGGSFEAFHWHGDTFDLPPGALHLASSKGCKHQAFSWLGHVLGIQFHLDSNAGTVRSLMHHCPGDLQPGPFVQAAATVAGDPERYARLNSLLGILMNAMDYSHIPSGVSHA